MSWWNNVIRTVPAAHSIQNDLQPGTYSGNPLINSSNARVNILRVEGGMVVEVHCWKSDDRNHFEAVRSKILTEDQVDQMGVTIQTLYVQCQLELKGR